MKIKCISEGFFDNALKTLGMAALSGATKGLYNYSMAADFKLPPEYFAAVYFHTSGLYTAEKVNNKIKQSMQKIFSDPSSFDGVIEELAKAILPGEKEYPSLIKKAREAAVPQPPAQATAAAGAQTTTGASTTTATGAQTATGASTSATPAVQTASGPTSVTAKASKPEKAATRRSNRGLTIPQLKDSAFKKALKITNIRYLQQENTLYKIIITMLDRIINNNKIGERIIAFGNNETTKRNWQTIKIRLRRLGNNYLDDNNYVWTLINHYLDEYMSKITEHEFNNRKTILELFNKITKDAEYQKYKSKREISAQQQNIQAASALRKMVTNMLIIYLNRTDTLLGGKLKEYTQTLNRYLESSKFADRDPEAYNNTKKYYAELTKIRKPHNDSFTLHDIKDTSTATASQPAESKNPFNKNFIFEAQYDD